jgi:hypothetical protein
MKCHECGKDAVASYVNMKDVTVYICKKHHEELMKRLALSHII